MERRKKVIVGLSGGVDSSVAALLLKQQGYEVIGLFMKNWHDDTVTLSDECPWLEDSNDALVIANRLGIPFQTVDLSLEYRQRIVDYMFAEYERGRTPNPDVLCNREIKFDVFLKLALNLGADYVATGHYCRKDEVTGPDGQPMYRLLAGKDGAKDQSYFLCQLTQDQLKYALFPIGDLQKQQVRELASTAGLHTANKKDSQGLCFVGKVRLPDFLQQKLSRKLGRIIEVPANSEIFQKRESARQLDLYDRLRVQSSKPVLTPELGIEVGEHPGAHFFTIGQRKGLDVGGTPEPLFVIDTDTRENIIYTGQGKEHPGLFQSTLFIEQSELHWVRPDLDPGPGGRMTVRARVRYRQALQEAVLYRVDSGAYLDFADPQSAVTPGQFAAWYLGDELIGSGVIQDM